uniref:RING-type domain-containing protein n=1 Tax=Angiostrongylus cantonensis TaxID=6313 RepID=A0A158PAG9_ANGCA
MEISIVNCSSGNVLVNDVAVSCGQKKELAFHDVITLVEGTGIMDRSRPCLTWESKSFMCVRYLEEKKLFTIGSDRGCDISLASPYLAGIHAELVKNVLRGAVQYSIKPAPASVSFCFYNEESEAVNEATSSTHQIQSTVSSSIPESSGSISQSRRFDENCQREGGAIVELCNHILKTWEYLVLNDDWIWNVVRQGQNDTLSLNQLEAHLTCCVCLNIFFKPINIDPCNHKCCYSCVLSWLRQTGFSGKCPQCRTTILCIKLDPALNSIVETFLHMKPMLRRSREEIALIEASEERNINEYQHLLQYSLTADAFRSQRRATFRRWMP